MKWAALAFVVMLIIVISSRNLERSRQQTIESGNPTETGTSLQVDDYRLERGEFGSRLIIGSARNTGDGHISYAQVEFNLYDSTGAQVGSTIANVNNLEPHGTWKFEAPVIESNVTSCKLKGVTGFE